MRQRLLYRSQIEQSPSSCTNITNSKTAHQHEADIADVSVAVVVDGELFFAKGYGSTT
jgi:hypothetical protein